MEHVYAIRMCQFVKIGRAKSFKRRRDGLQVGSPVPLLTVEVRQVVDAAWFEMAVHELLKDDRWCGEWFLVTDEQVVDAFDAFDRLDRDSFPCGPYTSTERARRSLAATAGCRLQLGMLTQATEAKMKRMRRHREKQRKSRRR